MKPLSPEQWPVRGEGGISLPEMMVGLLVFSFLVLVLAGWMSHANHTTRVIGLHAQTDFMRQTAIRLLREDFRISKQLLDTGRELQFINLRGDRIRYYLSDRYNLIRSVNGEGASVIATDIKDWHVKPLTRQSVEIMFVTGTGDDGVKVEVVLAGRGGGAE
jgi:type II secretory pathway pseudopilin PulG